MSESQGRSTGPSRAVPFVVGSYAAEPADAGQRDAFSRLLRGSPWVSGLEIPYPGMLASDPSSVARALSDDWTTNVVTLIPGTMQRLATDPTFGLASPDTAARARALEQARSVRDAVQALADAKGRGVVAAVELHSAPTRHADPGALRASLEQLLAWDWSGARLVVEHCDRWNPTHPAEKGFLSLEAEIEVARATGVGLTVNWGRACLDERSSDAAFAAVRTAHRAGVLAGLMFSGVSARATPYGPAWADAHLPATEDDGDSLMRSADIAACTDEALSPSAGIPPLLYLGAKVSAPKDASPGRRMQLVERVARAAGVTQASVSKG